MEFFATEAITATQFILEPSCLNVATAGRVVAYSQDGGATWNKGLDLTTVASMDQFVSMDFGGAGMEAPGGLAGYTNCYEGMSHLLVSQDLGSTWTPIYVLWGPPCGPDETRFEDVAMWGAPGDVSVLASQKKPGSERETFVILLEDGQEIPALSPADLSGWVKRAPFHLFAGSESGTVWMSENRGYTWQPMEKQPPGEGPVRLFGEGDSYLVALRGEATVDVYARWLGPPGSHDFLTTDWEFVAGGLEAGCKATLGGSPLAIYIWWPDGRCYKYSAPE